MLRILERHCHNAYGTCIPAGGAPGLHIMIQFRTRAFPTARRLAHTHAMHACSLHHYPTCGGDVLDSIKLVMLKYQHLECYRRALRTLGPEL
jgi:hypothetical protein